MLLSIAIILFLHSKWLDLWYAIHNNECKEKPQSQFKIELAESRKLWASESFQQIDPMCPETCGS